MAFGIAIAYNTGASRRLKILNTDLDVLFTGSTLLTNVYIAVNRAANIVYTCEANVLVGRSGDDGTLLYTEFESVGAQRPILVDRWGYLWTIDDTENNVVRKWAADLSSRTDYTLKVGNWLNDKIRYIALSYDGLYIYLLGYDGTTLYRRVSKYAVNNIDGGDPEWNSSDVILTDPYNFIVVSETSGAVYMVDLATSGGIFAALTKDGEELFGSSIYGYGLPAIIDDKVFIGVMSPDGVGGGGAKQLNALNGSYIGKIKQGSLGTSGLFRTCHVYDSDTLFIGCYENIYGGDGNGVYKFSITDDWVNGGVNTGEDAIDSVVFTQTDCYAYGDATGGINRQFQAIVSSDLDVYQNVDGSYRLVEHNNNKHKLVIDEQDFVYSEINGAFNLRLKSTQTDLEVNHVGLNT